MTIWISRELPFFNFEHLDILCPRIGHPCEKFWRFEFLDNFRFSISSVPLCYALESDIRVKSYYHSNFLRDLVVLFQASRYVLRLNRTSEQKVIAIWISREFPVFIFERLDVMPLNQTSVVKSYDYLNLSRAFVVRFGASRYVMRLNRTSVW